MPPIRRYLRITRYSVLEVRIHLDNPAHSAWLIQGSNAALPRIISAIRPLVLPKLREESERSKAKATAKKGGVKDVVTGDDFEVSIFLTDSPSRHSLLKKSKTFQEPKRPKRLMDWLDPKEGSGPEAVTIEDDDVPIRQESPEEGISINDIPRIPDEDVRRVNDDDSPIVVDRHADDDKKLAPRTTYEGFAIYGRVLCLIIKRRGTTVSATGRSSSSQQMMESWVSTQAVAAQTKIDEEAADS